MAVPASFGSSLIALADGESVHLRHLRVEQDEGNGRAGRLAFLQGRHAGVSAPGQHRFHQPSFERGLEDPAG